MHTITIEAMNFNALGSYSSKSISGWVVRCSLLFVLLFMPLQTLIADDKLRIFVSVLPQKLFVERVGGDAVDVNVMVKPGFSPATYEPSPRQIAALAKTQLYVRIGVPFEEAWLPRIRSVNPDMLILDARDGIELLDIDDHHHGEADHDSGHENEVEADPHLWTDPKLVIKMARQLKQQLAILQPEYTDTFRENCAEFIAELSALDAELQQLFVTDDARRRNKFLVFHPSWGYLAAAYGLTQLAIEAEGKEPGAKALQALIKQARQTGARTVFVQPQFDQRAARQVAKAIDGQVVVIDPLAADYFSNMRRAARLIAGVGDEQ